MRAMTWQLWVTLGAIALVCLLWLMAAGVLLWAVLDAQDFQTMVAAMNGRWGLLLFLWAISLVPIYGALQWAMNRYLAEPERLADAIDLRLKKHISTPIEAKGIPSIDRLAKLFNGLLVEHNESEKALDQRIQQALAKTEQERAWLSTLLAELNRSVVVCNREGQILLYNNRARLQFKRLSEAGHLTHGGELIGLGRSIHEVIDPALLEHATATMERRLAKGQRHASTQCLMQTDTRRTYRIHITPICREAFAQTGQIDGMILVIENITDEVKLKQEHTESLQALAQEAEQQREALSSGGLDGPETDVLRQHKKWLDALAERLNTLPKRALKPYPLEDMSAEDWLEAITQALPDAHPITIQPSPNLETVWLRVDGMSLVRALASLLLRAQDQSPDTPLNVQVDFDATDLIIKIPIKQAPSDASLSAKDWFESINEHADMAGSALGQTVDEVVAYHGGQWSFTDHDLTLRLPRIPPLDALPEGLAQRHEGRPEYYDFGLFDLAIADVREKNTPLSQLTYTVFDTETTGLNPSKGDEIIQIGAVRIVNGRILNKENFDQLVDPKRPISSSSTAIHGIRPQDIDGQPDIGTVLPMFHRFCDNTVLVAHNADFDLKCLSLKAPLCGLVFNQPVLDTLLLSALAHPFQESHNLDELAVRLGIELIDRHRALGDAKMTAEVLIRLLPILEERGIKTLNDALVAQRSVWQKRASH